MFEDQVQIDLQELPFMYVALLEYCSELTGKTTQEIDQEICYQMISINHSSMEKLNG